MGIKSKIAGYLEKDKLMHFALGFFIYVIANYFFIDVAALGVIFGLAFINEVIDEFRYGGFDLGDIVYSVIPGIFLLVVGLL